MNEAVVSVQLRGPVRLRGAPDIDRIFRRQPSGRAVEPVPHICRAVLRVKGACRWSAAGGHRRRAAVIVDRRVGIERRRRQRFRGRRAVAGVARRDQRPVRRRQAEHIAVDRRRRVFRRLIVPDVVVRGGIVAVKQIPAPARHAGGVVDKQHGVVFVERRGHSGGRRHALIHRLCPQTVDVQRPAGRGCIGVVVPDIGANAVPELCHAGNRSLKIGAADVCDRAEGNVAAPVRRRAAADHVGVDRRTENGNDAGVPGLQIPGPACKRERLRRVVKRSLNDDPPAACRCHNFGLVERNVIFDDWLYPLVPDVFSDAVSQGLHTAEVVSHSKPLRSRCSGRRCFRPRSGKNRRSGRRLFRRHGTGANRRPCGFGGCS